MEVIKLKDYNHIYYVDVFENEYAALFTKSKTEYQKNLLKLRQNLRILDSEDINPLRLQQFEKLEGENLYAIRYVSKSNSRVIYAYMDERQNIILLSACKEKGKSDYRSAIEKARQRYRILEELE